MKQTVAFDFDGVIHKYSQGWKDGSIYDELNLELIKYMISLLDKYHVIIYSTRNAQQIVKELNKLKLCKFRTFNGIFWNSDKVIGVTNVKPAAILYVDDRAFEYIPNLATNLNILMLNARLESMNETNNSVSNK